MMATREPLEWHFKQLDHAVGLSFKANFHFALVGHLLKGFRHSTPTTVSRASRVLAQLLTIVAKPFKRDKFEVSPESVAYLAALVSVSEEVRSRCHVKHGFYRMIPDSMSVDNFPVDLHLNMISQVSNSYRVTTTYTTSHGTTCLCQHLQPNSSPASINMSTRGGDVKHDPVHIHPSTSAASVAPTTPTNRRQKSWDLLDQNALTQARHQKQQHQVFYYFNISTFILFLLSNCL